MTHTCRCPRCNAELEFDAPKTPGWVLGKPRLRTVPLRIPPETARLADQLRHLADALDRGEKGGPDCGLTLLLTSESRHLGLVPHGMNEHVAEQVLRAAVGSVQARRVISK